VYKFVFNKTRKENLSAIIVSLAVMFLLIFAGFFIINGIRSDVSNIYSQMSLKLSDKDGLIGIECHAKNAFCNFINSINDDLRFKEYTISFIKNIASTISKDASEFLFSIPKRVIDALILFVLIFFFLKKGEDIWSSIVRLFPLKGSHKQRLLKRLDDTIRGVIYGYFIIALIEGFIGWLALTIVGSKMALILGIIIVITALLPVVGASIVWVPAALIYFFNDMPFRAAIIVFAGLILFYIDTWTRVRVIGQKAAVHPFVVLLGVLGGAITFGLVGVVIGPLVLSLLITSLKIYEEEKDSFLS
jgi:predicted PurR-regulated permease PerM